jgi:hypothetical protein
MKQNKTLKYLLLCAVLPDTQTRMFLFAVSQVWPACPSDMDINSVEMCTGHWRNDTSSVSQKHAVTNLLHLRTVR